MLAAVAGAVGILSASPSLPLPTAAQLRWMQDEVTAMGSYNMGTYEACGIGAMTLEGTKLDERRHLSLPKGSVFNPTNLNVTQWLIGLKSFGAAHAVLTLSHGCGYALYPVRTAFPDFNFTYDYNIRQSPYKEGSGDIAQEFVDACKKYGIRPGFYNGIVNNVYLNVMGGVAGQTKTVRGQRIVTQEQYGRIVLANLRQQWTDYGELAEIWFDGGYPKELEHNITALLNELQPNAVVFQGPVTYANNVRWAGTETAHPGYPLWSTAKNSQDDGRGEPNGTAFVPAESDVCFQRPIGSKDAGGPYAGCWFYNPSYVPKTVKELMSEYYDTVGSNSYMMLDWSPRPQGDMNETHMARYLEFGQYRAECMKPLVELDVSKAQWGNNIVMFDVTLPAGATVDKVTLMEDISQGERVRSFQLFADGAAVARGVSMGHKRIQHLSHAVHMTILTLMYTAVGDLKLKYVALHAPCKL